MEQGSARLWRSIRREEKASMLQRFVSQELGLADYQGAAIDTALTSA